jgi:hypothetical protein
MNAIDLRAAEQAPVSGFHAKPESRAAEVRQRFVDNWGRLSATFGMPRDLGRVHAQLFIEEGPVDVASISQSLHLAPDMVRAHLGGLLDWGVVRTGRGAFGETYATARDPWDFFIEIVRQRLLRGAPNGTGAAFPLHVPWHWAGRTGATSGAGSA